VEVSGSARIVGDDANAVHALARACLNPSGALAPAPARSTNPGTRGFELALIDEQEPPAVHARRIRDALELIAQGEIYEVNLAREVRFGVRGNMLAMLAALGARTRAPFSALLRLDGVEVLASSPELCLELTGNGRIMTCPIKGTRPRGDTLERDQALAAELDKDPKERAELTMVIDVERNDLGRVCRTGSVQLTEPPHVQTHPTLHHRVATVSGELRPEVSRDAVLQAMLPSGSVTGAPKVRAMEVIAQLEAARRGAYTGAFGYIRHDGGLELAMAIRVLSVQQGIGRYLVGGGIVADSDPEREVEETLWKARHVLDLCE
jgi:anthranilate/para-aminobenzoate synthase component I